MLVQFEIESIFKVEGRGYFIFARHLSPGQHFEVTEKSFLGDVEITKYLDQPRALDEKSRQRSDLFAFHLKNELDVNRLVVLTIVALKPANDIHFLSPWDFTDVDLTEQLHREINKDHILFGRSVKTIARRQDNDDVLFELEDDDFKYAAVHLTWAQKALNNCWYPKTRLYKNWREVYEDRIVKDNIGWED